MVLLMSLCIQGSKKSKRDYKYDGGSESDSGSLSSSDDEPGPPGLFFIKDKNCCNVLEDI